MTCRTPRPGSLRWSIYRALDHPWFPLSIPNSTTEPCHGHRECHRVGVTIQTYGSTFRTVAWKLKGCSEYICLRWVWSTLAFVQINPMSLNLKALSHSTWERVLNGTIEDEGREVEIMAILKHWKATKQGQGELVFRFSKESGLPRRPQEDGFQFSARKIFTIILF